MTNQGLPVKGYQPQSGSAVEQVNINKVHEEKLLRRMDEIAAMYRLNADTRWFSIARTHFEQGFMALNRSIFKPGRVELDEDDAES